MLIFPFSAGKSFVWCRNSKLCLERGCRAEVHHCSLAQAPTHMACRRLQRFTGAGDRLAVHNSTLLHRLWSPCSLRFAIIIIHRGATVEMEPARVPSNSVSLPPELLLHILYFVDVPDLLAISRVGRPLRSHTQRARRDR